MWRERETEITCERWWLKPHQLPCWVGCYKFIWTVPHHFPPSFLSKTISLISQLHFLFSLFLVLSFRISVFCNFVWVWFDAIPPVFTTPPFYIVTHKQTQAYITVVFFLRALQIKKTWMKEWNQTRKSYPTFNPIHRQQTATGIFLNQVQWNNNQEAKLQVEFHEIPP
jgi:hypothetical protein